MPLHKSLGKREPSFPIMLSWDSQSGMPYLASKFITYKKYTCKKKQPRRDHLKKPSKPKSHLSRESTALGYAKIFQKTSGTRARD